MNKAVQLENETSSAQQFSENGFQDEETKNVSISFFIYRLIAYADARRSIAAFIFILLAVIISDNLFNNLLFELQTTDKNSRETASVTITAAS